VSQPRLEPGTTQLQSPVLQSEPTCWHKTTISEFDIFIYKYYIFLQETLTYKQ